VKSHHRHYYVKNCHCYQNCENNYHCYLMSSYFHYFLNSYLNWKSGMMIYQVYSFVM